MSTDTLDSTTDAELSTIFALEVAKLRIDPDLPIVVTHASGPRQIPDAWEPIPKFATSADAVLPFIEKRGFFLPMMLATDGEQGVQWQMDFGYGVEASAPTFARAACIALIRAKRATTSRTA